MSFLDAARAAAVLLIGRKPSNFFSSTEQFEMELCELARDAVEDLATDHEWRALTVLHTITGNGTAAGFDLPADFDRLPVEMDVTRPGWTSNAWQPARDLAEWQALVNRGSVSSPGSWILLNGQIQFYPVLGAGEQAQFYYLSRHAVMDANAVDTKPGFTQDGDTFRLNERLLTLSLIWRHKKLKRLAYDDELSEYQKMAMKAAGTDRGARKLAIGGRRFAANAGPSYPYRLGN
ncbi:hypothetical protein FHS55_002634 [Angulomicrobium tetraedrale]|uniref:Uncharacterized protein n=1 Tax=Ancylobacter tetraedralis TaxID=217068 RepID=A0A839ZBB9_9HYPH|nr:hypothetical protein [Ancylobacter tetraedralis]MBB3772025.1 hypothetical protein [Ancylobacter tetraedralis]